MSNPIFISYSSKDASLANKLVSYVEEHGYNCWIAPRDITSGEDYTDLINNAIKSCMAVIIIVSDKSIRSQWVKKELTTAVSYNKKLIPFKIQNVVLDGGLEFILNNVQWIDASSNMTSHFPDIIEGLRYVQPANPTMTVAQSTSRNKGKNNMIMWGSIAAAAVIAILLVVVAPWSKKGEPQEEPVVEVASDTTTLEKNEIEENVRSVINMRLISRVALIEKLMVLRIKRHLIVADVKFVADTDKAPTKEEIGMEAVCKPLLFSTPVTLERANITRLQRKAVQWREISE